MFLGEAIFISQSGHLFTRQCSNLPITRPAFLNVRTQRPDSVIDGMSVYQSRLNRVGWLSGSLSHGLITTPTWSSYLIRDELQLCKWRNPQPSIPRGLCQEPLCWTNLHHARSSIAGKVRTPKANAIEKEFRGKNVLLVDDSIVRGTTSAQIIEVAET